MDRTIVIGLGNPVRADDGVGLAVARAVRARLQNEPVEVAELWAGGMRLVESMVGYDRAIVVDALDSGRWPPGSLRRLDLDDLRASRTTACTHDTSLPAALELWRRVGAHLPREISIWGIEVLDVNSFSEELTEPVARAVPGAAAAILEELQLAKGA